MNYAPDRDVEAMSLPLVALNGQDVRALKGFI